jgi:hypothetical protein
MKIKYFGTSWETGMTLTAKIYDYDGQEVGTGHSMTETAPNTGIYATGNIIDQNDPLSKGLYVSIIEDASGIRRGYNEFIWDGIKEVTLDTLDNNTWTPEEMRQIRDALGVDGDKSVATDGQLQKKSEEPYNNIVDTNKLI